MAVDKRISLARGGRRASVSGPRGRARNKRHASSGGGRTHGPSWRLWWEPAGAQTPAAAAARAAKTGKYKHLRGAHSYRRPGEKRGVAQLVAPSRPFCRRMADQVAAGAADVIRALPFETVNRGRAVGRGRADA